jgi:TolB-like protein
MHPEGSDLSFDVLQRQATQILERRFLAAPKTAPQGPLPLPDKPSIAVLPFQNMSGDPEQEYFADGMVEDIITALSRTKALFVSSRNSSFTYKGKPPDCARWALSLEFDTCSTAVCAGRRNGSA